MVDTLTEPTGGRASGSAETHPSGRAVSPAAHLAEAFAAAEVTGARGVRIRELGLRTMVGLRAEVGTAAAARMEAVLGVGLPQRCGVVALGGPGEATTSVCWFGPDEFLVLTEDSAAAITGPLQDALGADPGAVVDLSANRTTFELAGPSARAVLEKGCPLDLHPRAFAVGAGYLTAVGSVPVFLRRTGEQCWELLPRSSFADFLGRWLLDATAEFQGPAIG